jgi:hypothetical protein
MKLTQRKSLVSTACVLAAIVRSIGTFTLGSALALISTGAMFGGDEGISSPQLLAETGRSRAVSYGKTPPPRNYNLHTLVYSGGPVMLNHINVYVIWYGDIWYNPPDSDYYPVMDFISNIGKSAYWAINSKYYQQTGGNTWYVTNNIYYADDCFSDSQGNNLTRPDLAIAAMFDGGTCFNSSTSLLTADSNGIYVLLASPGVTLPNPGCGYQDVGWYGGPQAPGGFYFPFIAIPYPSMDPAHCELPYASPNSVTGDALVNQLARLLSDTATNPIRYATPGWQEFDTTGQLIGGTGGTADVLCSGQFGPLQLDSSGKYYSLTLPSSVAWPTASPTRNYLVQQNWVFTDAYNGKCAMQP